MVNRGYGMMYQNLSRRFAVEWLLARSFTVVSILIPYLLSKVFLAPNLRYAYS